MSKRIILLLLVLALVLFAVGVTRSDNSYILLMGTQVLIWVLLAASWDFLSGYTGQVSFGHGGFFAIGAYSAALTSLEVVPSSWVGILCAMLVAAAFGFIVGLPTLRLKGHYLALVTLAFGEVIRMVASNWTSLTGGLFGLHDFGTFSGLPADEIDGKRMMFLIVMVFVVLSVALLYVICERTRVGEIFKALKEDDLLCQAHGINTTRYKLGAFSVSAAFAGLAGALYAYVVQLVGPALSESSASAMVIGMAVFGGVGTILGPAVGAFLLFSINEGLRFVGVVYNLMLFGAIIMLFVIFAPNGVLGLFRSRSQKAVRGDAKLFAGEDENTKDEAGL